MAWRRRELSSAWSSGRAPSRNDALDGLRLLAVVAVMAFHFGLPHADAGFLGVDVFFVLSGYLITSLLLTQLERGRVELVEFWDGTHYGPGAAPLVARAVIERSLAAAGLATS